jgi:nucleoside-diphosphate-sugar epimerase
MASDLSWTILRLPMIFGPGDRNRRFAWAIHSMTRGASDLALDKQWAEWRTSLGYVENVADALVLAATHPAADGRTFNVGPEHVKTNREWAIALKAVVDWRGEIRVMARDTIPEPAQKQLGALDLTVPIRLNTSAIRQTIGYTEVVSEADALAATIAFDR